MQTTAAPAVPADLASRLRLAIARTARRLRQEALASEGGELSPTLSAALATIEVHGPLAPSELAERERVKRPTATRVIARLADAGLIERTTDPHDRRAALVSISPAGRKLVRRLRRRKDEYLGRRLAALDGADIAALERAADVLERMLESGGSADGRR